MGELQAFWHIARLWHDLTLWMNWASSTGEERSLHTFSEIVILWDGREVSAGLGCGPQAAMWMITASGVQN